MSLVKKINTRKGVLSVLFLCFMVLLFISFVPTIRVLSLTNRKDSNECVLFRGAIPHFQIGYTHSVNKGRVKDFYLCKDDNTLQVYKTLFVSYGAGIPEAEETDGAYFVQTEQGYEIQNLNRNVEKLVMAVGVIANHSIIIDEKEYFLTEYFAPKTSLSIEIKNVPLLKYINHKK